MTPLRARYESDGSGTRASSSEGHVLRDMATVELTSDMPRRPVVHWSQRGAMADAVSLFAHVHVPLTSLWWRNSSLGCVERAVMVGVSRPSVRLSRSARRNNGMK